MNQPTDRIGTPRWKTGVPGFDEILGGGFVPNRLYLIDGDRGIHLSEPLNRFRGILTGVPLEIPAASNETELMRTEAGHVE